MDFHLKQLIEGMNVMDLNVIWFCLIYFFITIYAILDGFDFGIGILSLLAKNNIERKIHFRAIAPVWDGNEVWLITGGGVLFAAFPPVYATIFSGFYIPFIFVLFALIFRAISFEFHNKIDSRLWRKFWDGAFGFSSLLLAILFGVAVGNILRGLPLNAKGEYIGSFIALLNPYSIAVGILSLFLFSMHGAIYLVIKTKGDLYKRLQKYLPKLWVAFILLYLIITGWTWLTLPHLFENTRGNIVFYISLTILIATIVYLPVLFKSKKFKLAFLTSSLLISSLFGIIAVSLFPNLVPSSIEPSYNLNIYNSSSSQSTLYTLLIITIIGIPIVASYSIFIHRVFKGKIETKEEGY